MILRLNKKVMAILSFWTILSLQVPIIKAQSPAGASETHSFSILFCQITLYMLANILRDIKGVIWELMFKTQRAYSEEEILYLKKEILVIFQNSQIPGQPSRHILEP